MMRQLTVLDERHRKDGMHIFAIALDGPNTRAHVGAMTRGVPFPILTDEDGSVTVSMDPTRTVPFVILYDCQGRRKQTWHGFMFDEGPELERAVLRELKRC